MADVFNPAPVMFRRMDADSYPGEALFGSAVEERLHATLGPLERTKPAVKLVVSERIWNVVRGARQHLGSYGAGVKSVVCNGNILGHVAPE